MTLLVQGDYQLEANELVRVALSNPTGNNAIATEEASATIANDDGFGALVVSDASITEGDSGVTAGAFVITRSAGLTGTVTVDYFISAPGGPGRASAADLSGPLSGTITFLEGESSKLIPFGVVGDKLVEGTETFTVTIGNISGGAVPSDALAIASILDDDPTPPRFRLLGADGFVGSVKGSGEVFGTNGFQDIIILAGSGSVTLDGSFTRGNDVVRMAGNAAAYTIAVAGSNAVLNNGASSTTIPLGSTGLALVFDDGVRKLFFDAVAGSAKIGAQAFSTTAVQITASTDGFAIPTGADPAAVGRLVLAESGDVSIAGNVNVFGTNGVENLHLLDGNATLDGSFARGGDALFLPGAAASYSAYIAGSGVVLTGNGDTIAIPVGSNGARLGFLDDDRTLKFDLNSGNLLIGAQVVSATSAASAGPLATTAPTRLALDSFDDTGRLISDGVTRNAEALTITGFAEANSTVTIREGSAILGAGAVNARGEFYIDVSLAEGTHGLTATAAFGGGPDSTTSFPLSITVDRISPSVVISALPGEVGPGQATVLTFTFSEQSFGFVASDISVSGGMLSNFALSADDPNIYTATLTVANALSGVAVSIAEGTYADLAGNPGGAASLNIPGTPSAVELSASWETSSFA